MNIAARGTSIKVLKKRTVGCSHTDNVSVMWEVFHCNTCRGTGKSDYSLVSVWVHVSAAWIWCNFLSQNKCYKHKTSWRLPCPLQVREMNVVLLWRRRKKRILTSTTWFSRFTSRIRGTTLQAGRSRVRFPMASLESFIDIIHPAALWPWGWLSL